MLKTLSNSDLKDVTLDLAELALDSALAEGVAKDLPILGSLAKIWSTGKTVRDYLFTKKLFAFLTELSSVDVETRQKMATRLQTDADFIASVGEGVIMLLDRLDSITKATLVGRAFRAYCVGAFDAGILQRINHAIDRILLSDLNHLPRFVETGSAEALTMQAFINAGLAYIPIAAASTEITADREVCDAMIKHVLLAKRRTTGLEVDA